MWEGGGVVPITVNRLGVAGNYSTTFTDSDLTAGVLSVAHSLSQNPSVVQVYDNSNKNILPDAITVVDTNNVTIDLTSWGTLTGTWRVVCLG